MRTFYSESTIDYSSYQFNYAIYAVSENRNDIDTIYNSGFLPYTAQPSIQSPIFYMARSLRVNFSQFKETSENRRTVRAMADLNPTVEWIPIDEFDTEEESFVDFCSRYAQERFKGGAMSPERLKYVLSLNLATHIIICRQNTDNDQKILAYVIVAAHGNSAHYWYAFLNLEMMYDYPLGKFIMWRSIQSAHEKGYDFMYLGTCYGNHSLYKVRDHKGLEFFDGARWNNDVKLLKQLCKSDAEVRSNDFFKQLSHPQEFLDNL